MADDLFGEPQQALSRVHEFLGISDRGVPDRLPVAQNATAGGAIDEPTKTLLRERFREPNERLWSLLGEDWGWNDR